jgi:GNAT superfamily N-acetyltransferase
MIEIELVRTRAQKRAFLTFPWTIYRSDPLWVPPLLPERRKAIDPARGLFFQTGQADLFLAYRQGRLAGTICCSHEEGGDPGECSLGFFECEQDYAVAEALFRRSSAWAGERGLSMLCGTYNLDREDSRGVLIDGRDRPPAILCGHNPPYYPEFFERFGFRKRHDDGLAYAIDIESADAPLQRLHRLAEGVRRRRAFSVRGANLDDLTGEIERVWTLQNRALEHLPGFVPYSRESIAAMLLPLKDLADPELVLFAEADGETVGWFPAIPNFNEILIHLNGLRYPWDYLRALRYRWSRPRSLSVKAVAVLPEYWDSGVAILLFDEMARRAIPKGYRWVDFSITGEDNPDTKFLAQNAGARVYKRYRFYQKMLA